MDTMYAMPPHRKRALSWREWAGAGFQLLVRDTEALIVVVTEWRERIRQRHQLSMLSERDLDDIGISRADVALEIAKPFWRA